MSLQDILSHTSQIRGLLTSLENIASTFIPGAGPVIAGIQAVQEPVLNTVQTALTGQAVQNWNVFSTSDLSKPVYTGPRDDAENWANANMPSGFALIPVAPSPAS